MFCFLGIIACPVSALTSEFASLWPDADFAIINEPIEAVAIRLTSKTKPSNEGELPNDIVNAVKSLSAKFSSSRFLLLRADCWGGDCFYNGNAFQAGRVEVYEAGQEKLRPMIQFLGGDIGEQQIFDPLRRDFVWQKPPK